MEAIKVFSQQNLYVTNKISKINRGESYESILKSAEVDAYKKHLAEKFYGRIFIENIPRDQNYLERVGGKMSGRDVIIAPNIFSEMMNDKATANYYESKIKNIFDNIPRYTQELAARGLTFESCGVVVHEDGTITHICGGGDSPERVAEVNKINAERRKKKFEQLDAVNEIIDEKIYLQMINKKRLLQSLNFV